MAEDLEARARRVAVPYYEDALPAHDAFHAERVRDLALRLADECEAAVDRDVLAAASWLHDIGRPRERTGEIDDHDRWASERVPELLADAAVGSERLDAIAHCLRSHSIRTSSPTPETIEAKLLFDADKLDAAGARGIVRLACIVGERSGRAGDAYAAIDDAEASTLSERELPETPDVSLLREWAAERLDRLYTDPARRLGRERRAFLASFFERFDAERGVGGTK